MKKNDKNLSEKNFREISRHNSKSKVLKRSVKINESSLRQNTHPKLKRKNLDAMGIKSNCQFRKQH